MPLIPPRGTDALLQQINCCHFGEHFMSIVLVLTFPQDADFISQSLLLILFLQAIILYSDRSRGFYLELWSVCVLNTSLHVGLYIDKAHIHLYHLSKNWPLLWAHDVPANKHIMCNFPYYSPIRPFVYIETMLGWDFHSATHTHGEVCIAGHLCVSIRHP